MRINTNKKDNEIIIRYKINKNDLKIRIFGDEFVKKNVVNVILFMRINLMN